MAVLQFCRWLEFAIEFPFGTGRAQRLAGSGGDLKTAKSPCPLFRIVCSKVQTEEARNDEHYDHDADDVEDIHCALRARRP
jgi:hypothetical protein